MCQRNKKDYNPGNLSQYMIGEHEHRMDESDDEMIAREGISHEKPCERLNKPS